MSAIAPTDAQLVVATSVEELRGTLAAATGTIGFVPTMGALHDGHRRLVEQARAACDVAVVSCYVNPTQFGAGEDLDRYPRTPAADRELVAAAGADVLWLPTDRDVYGVDPDRATRVVVDPAIGSVLEGAARPGHFDGVASVVVRLLGAVRPDVLWLGRKDYQQLVVLRRVVADLLLGVEVRDVATVREPDGVARSSRNAYLDPEQRAAARRIPAAIDAAADAWARGERSAGALEAAACAAFGSDGAIELEYATVVRDGTLERIDPVVDPVLLVAARVGATRLIDNHLLTQAREERP